MSAFFAFISGWVFLARRFRASSLPEGQTLIGQVKQMGVVPENRVTHMIVSESGLYLYASPPFWFMHPALLILWPEVRLIRENKRLWWYTYELDLGSTTSLRVTQRAYEIMRSHLAQA